MVFALQVIENREATGDVVRKASEAQFRKFFFGSVPTTVHDPKPAVRMRVVLMCAWAQPVPSATVTHQRCRSCALLAMRLPFPPLVPLCSQEESKQELPSRKFRRAPAMWGAVLNPDARMKLALLEYGEKTSARTHITAGVAAAGSGPNSSFAAAAAAVSQAFGGGAAPSAGKPGEAGDDDAAAAEERRLMEQMLGVGGLAVSGSSVVRAWVCMRQCLRPWACVFRVREWMDRSFLWVCAL